MHAGKLILLSASLTLATAAAASQTRPQPGEWRTCTKPRHYDGDNIRCDDPDWRHLAHGHGMRIAALDAPELDTPAGKRARDAIRAMTFHKPVQCAWNGTWAPGWSGPRPVVDCRVQGADLACMMVRARKARWWPRFDPGGHRRAACRKVS